MQSDFLKNTLCARCKNVKLITNRRGSTFLMCLLHKEDERFMQYPPQPVEQCDGFREKSD